MVEKKNILQETKYFSTKLKPKIVDIEPIPSNRHFIGSTTPEDFEEGVQAFINGQVAIVCLAGGQASRLGADVPKGIFPLPINDCNFDENEKTLFYLQALSLCVLHDKIKEAAGNKEKDVTIPWIIMTSKSTDEATKKYFKKFIEPIFHFLQIEFIQQSEIPCYDLNGNFIKNKNEKIMTSPNGNGGFYEAIRDLLPNLRDCGIKYFHVYCVDNILNKVGDPNFIGKCIREKADCASKVVETFGPQEIGIIGIENRRNPEFFEDVPENISERYISLAEDSKLKNKSISIRSFSEITKEQAERRDPKNPEKLSFQISSIANHFYHIDFLSFACYIKLPYHIAKKNIIHIHDGRKISTPGIKLEKFIYEAFAYSRNFLVYEIKRDEEFAPLKNSDVEGINCPSFCVKALDNYHKKYCNNNEIKKCSLCKIEELKNNGKSIN